eukprot:GHVP01054383.1.p1 GENE.GHVP01054383.1~~GHVP01054383.1.p1  ORF type:complete len:657 (-),score=122.07 GHVP01054383.1:9-1979(-)
MSLTINQKVNLRGDMAANKQESRIGYLQKWTNYVDGYKRRWFVVTKNAMSYYRTREDTECRRRYKMKTFYVREAGDDKRRFILAIGDETKTHVLDLKAETAEERAEWVKFFKKLRENELTTLSEAASTLRDVLLYFENTNKGKTDKAKSYLKQINVFAKGNNKKTGVKILRASEIAEKLTSIIEMLSREEIRHEATEDSLMRLQEREHVILRKYKELWDQTGSANENNELLSYDFICKELSLLSLPEQKANNSIEDVFYDIEEQEDETGEIPSVLSTEKRDVLPASSTDVPKMGIFKIIKEAIGKDITRIALPINFSEPLSLLQRFCEDMEYQELLEKANNEEDGIRRLAYVAAFAVSGYSSTDNRLTRPFNPLLGETYEYTDVENGFSYIAEQVSHHPPICATHCESDSYITWGEINIESGFNGSSASVTPKGYTHVYLKKTNEHYSWRKVKTSVNNIIFGKMWIEHKGKMEIINHKSGDVCQLTFESSSSKKSKEYQGVKGVCLKHTGEKVLDIYGRWNQEMNILDENGKEEQIWIANPRPSNSREYYQFTSLSMQLNSINSEMIKYIAPTDSRLRPDQRNMENGEWGESNRTKKLLEEAQRKRRKVSEKNNVAHIPAWFFRENEEDTGQIHWKFTEEYWKRRGKYSENDIFSI